MTCVSPDAPNDSATMSGATSTAGGTITFNLFSPSDATCTGLSALSQTVPVSGNGTCRTGCWLAAEIYNLGLGCLDSQAIGVGKPIGGDG